MRVTIVAILLLVAFGLYADPYAVIGGSEVITINGPQSYLDLRDSAKATLKRSADVSHAMLSDSSEIVLEEGSRLASLTVSERSKAEIAGAELSFLHVKDDGFVRIRSITIRGGIFSAPGVSFTGGAIVFAPSATVHIHAADVVFDKGKLTGIWDTGQPFAIHMVLQQGRRESRQWKIPSEMPQQVVVHEPAGPSFECAKVANRVETAICGDEYLSSLDARLSRLYKYALNAARDADQLRLFQRAWLKRRNACLTASCIVGAYEARIAALERLTGQFRPILVRELCEQLAAPASRKQLLKVVSDDINNDGRPETAKTCSGGTMHVPCANYYDESGKLIRIEQVGFEWKDYWTFGVRRFRHADKTFFLHSYDHDLERPAYVSYITPANREHALCEFDNSVHAILISAHPESGGVCKAVQHKSSDIKALSLTNPSYFVSQARPETSFGKSGRVDVDNDGDKENVLSVLFSSGGGRGCDFPYFELTNDDVTDFAKGPERAAFLKMQGVEESGYWGRSCGGVVNRLFAYMDKVYYEQNVENNELLDHTVSMLERSEIKVMCRFGRQTRTSVSVVNPAPFD